MNLIGVHVTLMISESGPPRPVSAKIAQAVKDISVTHNDEGPSGFQITFHIGRSGPLDLMDYALLENPLLKPFNRVILLVRFSFAPEVLMDGIITNIQMSPGDGPGTSTLTVTGEDVSVMMDLEQRSKPFPAIPDYLKVFQIVTQYVTSYGLIPPLPPPDPDSMYPENPLEKIDQQTKDVTDREYIQKLARDYGYVFYVTPGPVLFFSTVHWGPPERLTIPQPALSVNMGPDSNVKSINFSYDTLKPHKLEYTDCSQHSVTVSDPNFDRRFKFASNRATAYKKINKIYTEFDTDAKRRALAQGEVNSSFYSVVTANGELDALRYERLLKPRSIVGLRGAGKSYDGNYYVKNVSHKISKGSYNQSFTLTREGTGTTTSFIIP